MSQSYQSYDAEIDPKLCPTAAEVVGSTLAAANEILDGLDHVEAIIALVVLQLFVEAHKSLMDEESLAAYTETLEASSFTTYPIIEADDGEE